MTLQLHYAAAGVGQQYPQIVVNDSASLVAAGGFFDVVPAASITLNRTSDDVSGSLSIRDGGDVDLRASAGSPNHLTNHGFIDVENGILNALGPVTIQGGTEGQIWIEATASSRSGGPAARPPRR